MSIHSVELYLSRISLAHCDVDELLLLAFSLRFRDPLLFELEPVAPRLLLPSRSPLKPKSMQIRLFRIARRQNKHIW